MRLVLLVLEHGLRRRAALYHAPIGSEASGRLGAVYDHLGGVVRVENVAAVGPDVLETVAHPALVLGALEDVAVLDALVLLDLVGHLLQLVPGLGGLGVAGLLQQVLAIVE